MDDKIKILSKKDNTGKMVCCIIGTEDITMIEVIKEQIKELNKLNKERSK
jgi:hypothetical protein